jgi:hypothetical protein
MLILAVFSICNIKNELFMQAIDDEVNGTHPMRR